MASGRKKRNPPTAIFQNQSTCPELPSTPIFSSEMIWELMITEGNKQKRQSQVTLPLEEDDEEGETDATFSKTFSYHILLAQLNQNQEGAWWQARGLGRAQDQRKSSIGSQTGQYDALQKRYQYHDIPV